MTLLRTLRRQGVRVLAPLVAATALLSACGGGTSQVEAFKPDRLLVLGDEASMLVDDGSFDGFKYGINDRRGTAEGKCLQLPNVAQAVANQYNMRFAACNPRPVLSTTPPTFGERPVPSAFIHARLNAKVDDATTGLKAQIDGITNVGRTDMLLVMIGANDIIDLYAQKKAGTLTAAQAEAEATRRGGVAAAQINRILRTGARALVITIPDMGKSPYAVTANKTDTGAAALMTTLSTEYNAALRLGIDSTDFDGRNYGLVLADDVTAAIARFPGSFLSSPANFTDAACNSATPDTCVLTDSKDTTTLVDGAKNATAPTSAYLWATDRHLGPVALTQIANQAISRAVNNPF